MVALESERIGGNMARMSHVSGVEKLRIAVDIREFP